VQLQQVFMNLMLNAIEAMEDSGGELRVKSQLQDGQLQFSVSDTGVGLPSEEMEQIFSAFFTTKPQGSGNGFGDQPFHCGVAWRPVVGHCQRRTRCNLSFHFANPVHRLGAHGCLSYFFASRYCEPQARSITRDRRVQDRVGNSRQRIECGQSGSQPTVKCDLCDPPVTASPNHRVFEIQILLS
jgi:hypothetical protein